MPEIAMPLDTKKVNPPETRSGTVTVACKLPSGLVLELHNSREEVSSPGAQKVNVYYGTGETFTLNGYNANHPDSPQNGARVIGGYGLTEVPERFWNKWIVQNADFPLVKNGMIFAYPTNDGVTSEAVNRKSLKTGFEPMDPDNPGPGLQRENGKAI